METKEIGLEIVQIRLIQDRIVYNEKPIHSPQDAVEILGNEIKDYDREVLCVLNLHMGLFKMPILFLWEQ